MNHSKHENYKNKHTEMEYLNNIQKIKKLKDRELGDRKKRSKGKFKSYFLNQITYLQMKWINLNKKND